MYSSNKYLGSYIEYRGRYMKFFIVAFSVCMLLFSSVQSYAQGDKGESGENLSGFEYVKLDTITIPIITNKGLTQQFSFAVSLEVDADKRDDISVFKPRLADAYIQDLYGALGDGYGFMRGDIVDVIQIKKRLTSVTNKVLGPNLKANGVLLQIINQRPL